MIMVLVMSKRFVESVFGQSPGRILLNVGNCTKIYRCHVLCLVPYTSYKLLTIAFSFFSSSWHLHTINKWVNAHHLSFLHYIPRHIYHKPKAQFLIQQLEFPQGAFLYHISRLLSTVCLSLLRFGISML